MSLHWSPVKSVCGTPARFLYALLKPKTEESAALRLIKEMKQSGHWEDSASSGCTQVQCSLLFSKMALYSAHCPHSTHSK